MILAVGVIVVILTLPAWLGQVLSAFSPSLAARLGLTEPEKAVDPVFHADVRAECWWDTLTLWTLPLGALLMLLDQPSWAVFSLAGGGMYVYFAGRGILQRLVMGRRGISVGAPSTVAPAYVALALWGLAGGVMVLLAVREIRFP